MIRPSAAEILANVHAAWRLFIRDASAADRFGTTPDAFWKSFYAAIVIIPAYLLLLVMLPNEARQQSGFGRLIVVEISAYAIGWALWPQIVAGLANILDFRDRYIRYIVAYNWSSVPQVLLMAVVILVTQFTSLDPRYAAFAMLIASVWIIFYHAFIVRVMVTGGVGLTLLLVVGELVIGQIILGIRDVLLLPMP